MNAKWQEYYNLTKNSPPSELLIKAINFVNRKELALDLGSGSLRDCRHLISEGFNKVIAVDKERLPFELVNEFSQNNFKLLHSSFDRFNFSEYNFNLVNAQFSLPFNPPETFGNVWKNIIQSLVEGGIFTGQFFGIRDEWVLEKNNMSFHTREKLFELFENFEILKLSEEERGGFLAAGTIKHWHIFHIIARKKAVIPEEKTPKLKWVYFCFYAII